MVQDREIQPRGDKMSDMDVPCNQLAEYELEDNFGDRNDNGRKTDEWSPVEDNNDTLLIRHISYFKKVTDKCNKVTQVQGSIKEKREQLTQPMLEIQGKLDKALQEVKRELLDAVNEIPLKV
jgi:hypothetical protein